MSRRRSDPTTSRPLVRRDDYRLPDWRVGEVALEIELDPDRTRVRARLEVERAGDHRRPLRLDGEGLKLLSLRVDGRPAAHALDRTGLTLKLAGERATVETLVEIAPFAVDRQKGLFLIDGILCTQCEAESFRRITFFPDRPDILARWRVRLVADPARWPVLLSNGNPAGSGALDDGRHWAEWDDPVPKSCYLFALVAGDLAARRGRFSTRSGREVELAVWTRPAESARSGHALESLEAAMRWDEQAFGREYELDRFDIVALPGFAYGAMENKGLNIFDSSLILVDPELSTDADHDAAAALVGHEYFHNWTGNRIGIRDWFELGLKEGLTVFRDQEYSAAFGSPAVKRIEDVRALRAAQFAEDESARAHAVRPECYAEPADLYTPTVFIKAAELVRMLRTWLGPDAFRAGTDLFFERHDGGAATWEDLTAAMAGASGVDLGGFERWYEQPGTPRVRADLRHDPESAQAILRLEQSGGRLLPIPLRVALFGERTGARLAERLLVLRDPSGEFAFDDIGERPVLSINRGFSAPVAVEARRSSVDLALLAAHEDDAFSRCEAVQELMLAFLADTAAGRPADEGVVVEAVRRMLEDRSLDRGVVAEAVRVPGESVVSARLDPVDPGRVHVAWKRLRAALGRALEPQWRAILAAAPERPYRPDSAGKADRQLRLAALSYLLAAGADGAGAQALALLREADNMTDREGALRALADSDAAERGEALAAFHARHRGDPSALDRWFAAQALSARDDTAEAAARLVAHPDFTLSRPSRAGALLGGFAANAHAFHDASGRGYRFIADALLALDRVLPAAAARLAPALARPHRLEPRRAAMMREQLERVRAASGLSPPVAALIEEALARDDKATAISKSNSAVPHTVEG